MTETEKMAEAGIEIELIEFYPEPDEKNKNQGCWGPSPDDHRGQC